MDHGIMERDWKYMCKIQGELLNTLYEQINQRTKNLLTQGSSTPRETYVSVYRHLQKSDDLIAHCFDDWRRSNLLFKMAGLREYGLLTEAHIQMLSPLAQEKLNAIKELRAHMRATKGSDTKHRKKRGDSR